MTTPMRVLALDAVFVMFGFAEASERSRYDLSNCLF
ncbi:MAG: hypothetical protein RI896_1526 [Pseudomonadota bacterium]|jgi:hypothetical protein